MTSVARKTHMPRLAASRCCSGSAKWCSRAGLWPSAWTAAAAWSVTPSLPFRREVAHLFVVVSFPGHDRLFVEIDRGRGRLRLPFESGGVPGIVRGRRGGNDSPEGMSHGKQIAYSE